MDDDNESTGEITDEKIKTPSNNVREFKMYSKRKVIDKWVPLVGIAAPVICYFISTYSEFLFNGYKFGFELLILNGLITIIGLLTISKKYVVKN